MTNDRTKRVLENFVKYFLDVPPGHVATNTAGYKLTFKPFHAATQTMLYMIGYCLKDRDEPWFRYVVKGIDLELMREGIRAHVRTT